MNLNVDFSKSIIKGVADHKMRVGSLDGSQSSAPINKVVLDVQGMNVEKVELLAEAAGPSSASFIQLDKDDKK